MKKIRFSIMNLDGGGAEKILVNILQHLPRNKYQLSLFLFEKSGVYLNDIPDDVDVKYFMNPDKIPSLLKQLYVSVIRKVAYRLLMYFPNLIYQVCGVKNVDLDVAFIQDTSYLLKTSHAKKKIAWIHNNIYNTPTFKNGLRRNLSYADKTVCVSSGIQHLVCNAYPELANRVITIYNPSPLIKIYDDACKNSIKFMSPTIIAVGLLKKQKGFKILVQSVKLLISRGINVNLRILGAGDSQNINELGQLIVDLDLSGHVELLGFKQNPYQYMKAANIFVLSSLWEGFGQVLVEALCLGVPIVSTDCIAGPKEILQDGECGLLVPVGDVEKLADGIELLMTDIKLREKFIARGLKRAQDFDLPKIMTQIEALFDEV
ncbi:MAG: glycosyltransferase [Burkholderiales bacterium]|nr:glycosyltransferase [Burkholderiales bacterium]